MPRYRTSSDDRPGMKRRITAILALIAATTVTAQSYVKLNLPYAAFGIINPQAEFIQSPHSAIAVDLTFSPWQSINDKHFLFGILSGEYRYYVRPRSEGFYLSGNLGMMVFDISKPEYFTDGIVTLRSGWSKGFGVMIGAGIGYEFRFRKRWVFDAFLAFDFMHSWYNGYYPNGEVNLYPNAHKGQTEPDPFNASAEWMPSKIGISIGYMILKPRNERKPSE